MEHRNYKVIYRRYASLFFLVGVDGDEVRACNTSLAVGLPACTLHAQNELAILEFIHCLVETLDRFFGNVCELDLMFNLEMVCACCCIHMIVNVQCASTLWCM